MTYLTLIIYALAAYRLTHFIVYDTLFTPVRSYFVTRGYQSPMMTFTLHGGPLRRFIGKIMNCYWCAGIWVSALIVIGHLTLPTYTFYISLIFALASIQALTETKLLKSVGMPLEMMEVKATHEEEKLSSARGIVLGIIITIALAAVGASLGYLLMELL